MSSRHSAFIFNNSVLPVWIYFFVNENKHFVFLFIILCFIYEGIESTQLFRHFNELFTHPHTPCSPSKAPAYYHDYHSVKNWQESKVDKDLNDLVKDILLLTKNSDFFAHTIDHLPSKWEVAIEVEGEHFSE